MPKYRGTGFEEFYADPPMTPDEAKEERENIYSPMIPFPERIEACIQRFRARRRITGADATKDFNYYLFLGGVDTNPRMFGGNLESELKDMTPEERRTATATDTIYSSGGGSKFYNADDAEGWDVDFTGIVAGFCSAYLPSMTNWDYARMGKAIGIVENFLTYVLQHDVCPEYEDDVKEAVGVCHRANVELPVAHQALLHLPGPFNRALSQLFCEGQDWEESDPGSVVTLGVTVKMLMDGASDEAIVAKVDGLVNKTANLIETEDCGMEVVAIHRATGISRQIAQTWTVQDRKIGALGRLDMKPYVIEDGHDRGDDAEGGGGGDSGEVTTFLVDDDALRRLQVGFKLQLRVGRLDNGMSFIQQVDAVHVEWYTFLPQSLMAHYKEPVANDRPAPTVASPGDGTDAMDKSDVALSDD
ncbi:Argonaute-binding protein 1 [Colletotrichum orbiculare MAFF 240422]|uniref:Argonaute-binding protein 1 n=1 Tax=Colletotrichum orbiculare (strain 104-T / ATCC 96160 / CBS 514.97 / LARS 414 / MAFF 240422) TaxID=1213857 RepID=N4ULT8_COLOR|nr:Argonaute-binding protein 1 [Colletotrichum orbiculare MAFF 240422]